MRAAPALAAVLLSVSGCTTTVPGSENVVLTRNPQDVVNCKVAGKEMPINREKFAKQDAYIEGADTILVTATLLGAAKAGVPYNCKGIDPRQPVPVKPQ